MKNSDIATLQELAADLERIIPDGLTIDGNGQIYQNGKSLQHMEVIAQIARAHAKADQLRQIVSRIEPRKANK